VITGTTKYKFRRYKEGDMVWMWDTQKGEPTNVKGSTQSWLRPFKVGMELVDDSYYLSTWREEGTHYLLVGTSSNPTKVGGPDFIGKYHLHFMLV
jgi:hypothetical protein